MELFCRTLYLVIIITVETLKANVWATTVAFTKGLATNLNLDNGGRLSLNKTITNFNANIDSHGTFHCQSPGIYTFHFSAVARLAQQVWLDLYKNDRYVCSLRASTTGVGQATSAGNSAILHLKLNDTVYILHKNSSTLYGSQTEVYTTFTGALAIDDEAIMKVAFSAGLTHHLHLQKKEILVFNDVITNIHNSYNILSGEFTAPVDGTYIFHYHGLAENDKDVFMELVHNGNDVNEMYSKIGSGYGTTGNTAILNLRKGDTVYVRDSEGYNGVTTNAFGEVNEVYSTFSGLLLAPLTFDPEETDLEVSFSVGLSKQQNPSQNVIFDRIYSNRGNGYSDISGKFTAPHNGVYMFHFYALANIHIPLQVDLYHNHQYVVSIYEKHSGYFYPSGGNAASIALVSGDTVYVKSKYQLYGVPVTVYCTFSGYLLRPSPFPDIGGSIIG